MITPERIHVRGRETQRMLLAPTSKCIAYRDIQAWPDVSPEAKHHVGACARCKSLVGPTVEETRLMFGKKKKGLWQWLLGFFR